MDYYSLRGEARGSCIALYYDARQMYQCWRPHTLKALPYTNTVGDVALTFSDLFEKVIEKNYDKTLQDWAEDFDKTHTYIFELISAYNPVVTIYSEDRIAFLAVRNNYTGREEPTSAHPYVKAYRPRIFDIDKDNLKQYLTDHLRPDEEGVVLVDQDFNRVKVKQESYVLMHKSISNVSTDRGVYEAVLNDEADDIKAAAPYLAERLDDARIRVNQVVHDIEQLHEQMIRTYGTDLKQIAIQMQAQKIPGVVMSGVFSLIRGNHSSTLDYLKDLQITKFVSYCINLKVKEHNEP